MSTRRAYRNDPRKLNQLRLEVLKHSNTRPRKRVSYITNYPGKVFKQTKRRWGPLKEAIALSAQSPLLPATNWQRFSNPSIKTHVTNLQRVRDLKRFYPGISHSQLLQVLRVRGKTYRERVRAGSQKASKKILRQSTSSLGFLESHLYTALYRRLLTCSIKAAYQAVTHGHVKVNGAVRRTPTKLLKPGDCVTLRASFTGQNLWATTKLSDRYVYPYRCPPVHLEVSLTLGLFVFIHKPYRDEIPYPFFPNVGEVNSHFTKG